MVNKANLIPRYSPTDELHKDMNLFVEDSDIHGRLREWCTDRTCG